ncbi:hypothetical protein FVE85_4781 [Porphyridium purpureum]|uniref:Uncharacterized protein n=1 Tax=Porphyridium purpureum TaxID=35688 RepID=A0A5J4YSG2_PORPP|nr:hypothetical protein FVE85_4781 [Porphyridium purpureum]|eukprot:POR3056..scf236_6
MDFGDWGQKLARGFDELSKTVQDADAAARSAGAAADSGDPHAIQSDAQLLAELQVQRVAVQELNERLKAEKKAREDEAKQAQEKDKELRDFVRKTLLEKKSENTQLQNELSEAQSQLRQLLHGSRTNQNNQQDHERELVELRAARTELEERVELLDAENAQLRQSQNHVEHSTVSASEPNREHTSAGVQTEISDEVVSVCDDIEMWLRKLNQPQEYLNLQEKPEARVSRLAARWEAMVSTVESLVTEKERLELALQETQNAKRAFSPRIVGPSSSGPVGSRNDRVMDLERKLADLERKLADLELANAQLQEKLLGADERAGLREQMTMYETELQKCTEQLQLANVDRGRLSEMIAQYAERENQAKLAAPVDVGRAERSVEQEIVREKERLESEFSARVHADRAKVEKQVLGEFQSRLDQSSKRLLEVQHEKDEAERKLLDTERHREEEHAALSLRLEAAQRQAASADKELANAKKELESLKYSLLAAERSLQENEEEHEKQVKKLQAELQSLQAKAPSQKLSSDNMQREINLLKLRLNEAEYARKAADASMEEALRARSESAESLAKLKGELSKVRADFEACRDALVASDARYLSLSEEYERSAALLRERSALLEALEISLNEKIDALELLRGVHAQSEKEGSAFREKAKAAVAQRDAAIQELEHELDALRTELHRAESCSLHNDRGEDSGVHGISAGPGLAEHDVTQKEHDSGGADTAYVRKLEARVEELEQLNVILTDQWRDAQGKAEQSIHALKADAESRQAVERALARERADGQEAQQRAAQCLKELEDLKQKLEASVEQSNAKVKKMQAQLAALQLELRKRPVSVTHSKSRKPTFAETVDDVQSVDSDGSEHRTRKEFVISQTPAADGSGPSVSPPEVADAGRIVSHSVNEQTVALKNRCERLDRENRTLRAETVRLTKQLEETSKAQNALESLSAW